MTKYNAWPLGAIPGHLARSELEALRERGYSFDDARDVVSLFEKAVADFAGSRFAVSVDCCSHGIFLCLKYLAASGEVLVPRNTYLSVPMQVLHAGCKPHFVDLQWSGEYRLDPYPIWDAAVRWTEHMYHGEFQVLSFQIKKRIPIGRGGMILTDDEDAARWLRRARYDGRDLDVPYPDDDVDSIGWHYYMTPEDAARGLLLMEAVPRVNEDSASWQNYPDLSTRKVFRAQ